MNSLGMGQRSNILALCVNEFSQSMGRSYLICSHATILTILDQVVHLSVFKSQKW